MSKFSKLINNPKLFIKDALEKRDRLNSERIPTFLIGFRPWKDYMIKAFPERLMIFIPKDIDEKKFSAEWSKRIENDPRSEIFVWGFKVPEHISSFAKYKNIKIVYVEDGFVRSVNLGATKAPPMSICLDGKTPYFNAREASDIEDLLNSYEFTDEIRDRAGRAIQLLLNTGVSKYNNAEAVDVEKLYGPKKTKRVLVIGQVEDDASIKYGAERPIDNNDLVRLAASENPGAQIIYKPHPDVLAGHREKRSDPAAVENICKVIYDKLPLAQSFETVDHVYAQTSLAGFEALLRGLKVTLWGAPFYAGWGLTDDRQQTPRRTRKLTLEELFAVSYLIYPKYFDPDSGRKVELEDVVEIISRSSPLDIKLIKNVSPSNVEVEKGFVPTFIVGNLKFQKLLRGSFNDRTFTVIPDDINEVDFNKVYAKKISQHKSSEIWCLGEDLPKFIKNFLRLNKRNVYYLNDGFLLSELNYADQSEPISLVLDSFGSYLDSRKISDLENMLNAFDFSKEPKVLKKAKDLLEFVKSQKITKYRQKFVSDVRHIYGEKESQRVLVVGHYSKAIGAGYLNPNQYSNFDLVRIAAVENPGAQIIFKPHPRAFRENIRGDINPAGLNGMCQIIDFDLAMDQALETVDQVYTVSSFAGVESIIRGVKTTVLGTPFYAGWGVSDDRCEMPRRARKLNVLEIFSVIYVVYPTYFDGIYKKIIDPVDLPLVLSRQSRENSYGDALVTMKVGKEEVTFDLMNGIKKAILVGFSAWKQAFYSKVLSEYDCIFLPIDCSAKEFRDVVTRVPNIEIFVWGYKEKPEFLQIVKEKNIVLHRIEDGFVRSLDLGASKSLPASVAIDGEHLYYDARGESNLERILAKYDFSGNKSLMQDAKRCMDLLISSRVSKYNHIESKELSDIFSADKKKNILVIGQVEGDASIEYGCEKKISNNDLVIMACLENPDANIYYKPHPDVLSGYREAESDPKLVESYATVIYDHIALADALDNVGHVYTITSLAGFEALIRGIKVTTIGCPFYAGWGLTDTRQSNMRRNRRLSVEEIFAGAYILYPKYFNLVTSESSSAIEVIEGISTLRKKKDAWLERQVQLMAEQLEKVDGEGTDADQQSEKNFSSRIPEVKYYGIKF